MRVSVDVVDSTGLVAGHEAVRGLVEAALAAEGISGEVTVAFVDEEAIADLNSRYRDAEGPTDVLSFVDSAEEAAQLRWPSPEVPGRSAPADGAAVAGEVVVCPQVVIRYAAEEDRDPVTQLGWTILHGVLHLAGYDHESDRGEMRRREQALLTELGDLVGMMAIAEACG